MPIQALGLPNVQTTLATNGLNQPTAPVPTGAEGGNLRKTFDKFVGETFYGQMLSAMRKTVHKSAYFDGGRAEEIFRGQLDQVVSEKLAESNASSFTGPMFELFALQQR